MRHLRKFNESESESVSIFDSNWTKLLPKELTIITENGEYTLKVKGLDTEHGYPGIYNLMNSVSFIYSHNTVEERDGDVNADGEPDNLQFDISIVKDNKGDEGNPSESLRLNIDLTYGDAMICEFTIDYPNKVNVHHYTGKNSLHDSETYFGFSDKSLKELVEFFNRFGFTTTPEDFKFLDKEDDSYSYEKELPEGDIEHMSLADRPDVEEIKGGNRIMSYKKFKR